MAINTAAIQQNSEVMFSLINQAQTQQTDVTQEVAKLATETKLDAQADAYKGALINMVV